LSRILLKLENYREYIANGNILAVLLAGGPLRRRGNNANCLTCFRHGSRSDFL